MNNINHNYNSYIKINKFIFYKEINQETFNLNEIIDKLTSL